MLPAMLLRLPLLFRLLLRLKLPFFFSVLLLLGVVVPWPTDDDLEAVLRSPAPSSSMTDEPRGSASKSSPNRLWCIGWSVCVSGEVIVGLPGSAAKLAASLSFAARLLVP